MALTLKQLQKIKTIIAMHHAAYVVNWFSPQTVPPDLLEELKRLGLVEPQAKTIEQSYMLGQLIGRAGTPEAQNMSFNELVGHIAKQQVPLSEAEERAVEMATQRAASFVVGLGNKIDTQTGAMLIEADAQQAKRLRQTITDKTAQAIEQRRSVRDLKSDLGWAMQDWTRDLNRIAVTEKHAAMEAGKADVVAKRFGVGSHMAILTSANCCDNCRRIATGSDGAPRIFTLAELEANGTNYGRKTAEWQAVIPPIHVNCQCTAVRVPDNWGFNEKFEMVPGGKLGIRSGDDALERAWRGNMSLQKALQGERAASLPGINVSITGRGQSMGMMYAEGSLRLPEGRATCLVGPDYVAPMAYVAKAQGQDVLLLGFPTLGVALQTYRDHNLSRARVLPADGVSELPMAALSAWANKAADKPTMELRRAISDNGTVVDVDDLDGTDALDDGTLTGAGSHGANFAFKVPVKKRPAGDNQDFAGIQAFVREPQKEVDVNPVRRTVVDYTVQARLPSRNLHPKTQAVAPISEAQRKKDTAVARDGLQNQVNARYGGWQAQDAKFIVRDLAGVVHDRASNKPTVARKPIKKPPSKRAPSIRKANYAPAIAGYGAQVLLCAADAIAPTQDKGP